MQPALNFRLISMSAVYYVGNIVYDIDGISRKVLCEASPPAGDMCAKESLIPSCTLFLLLSKYQQSLPLKYNRRNRLCSFKEVL